MELTIGCSIDDLRSDKWLRNLAVLNIENTLYPGYLGEEHLDDVDFLRSSFGGRIVLDGPYIDLNLGSPEPAIRSIALQRTLSAMSYAKNCGAEALIFQSTYLPFIGAGIYDKGWIEQTKQSWRSVLERDISVQIALCNTFEFYPDQLIGIAEALADSRIEIAFDVGHALIWGRIDPLSWYHRVRSRCRFIYLHSNDGTGDHHESIRGGLLHERGVLRSLRNELRTDSVLILKYFDRRAVKDDLRYLADIFR